MLTPQHVELYCKIKSDPFRRGGFAMESGYIFCEQVERRLEKLDDFDYWAVILQAQGYSQQEIAEWFHLGLRRMNREMVSTNARLFGELAEAIGKPVKGKLCASIGKKLGRPFKPRAA